MLLRMLDRPSCIFLMKLVITSKDSLRLLLSDCRAIMSICCVLLSESSLPWMKLCMP